MDAEQIKTVNAVLGMIETMNIADVMELFNSIVLTIETHDEFDDLDYDIQSTISDAVEQTNEWLDNNAGDYIADNETARNERMLDDMLRDDE